MKVAVPSQLLWDTRVVSPILSQEAEGTAMDRTVAMTWVLSVCTTLRLSQSKTLSELVATAMGVGRVSLADIGRRLGGSKLAKHRIKRTWRFVANQRVLVSEAMQGLVQRLAQRYQKLQRKGRRRRPKLLIAFDWVEIRNFHTLMAAAVQVGRAVPLLWATYSEWTLPGSPHNVEEGLVRVMRSVIVEEVEV